MFFAFLCVFSVSEYLKDRTVGVSLDGSWPDTPLLSEAAAFVADANSEAYWTFINGLRKEKKYPETEEEINDYALNFLSEELRSLLKLSLYTRAYSPRIEMFRQIIKNSTDDINKPVAVYADKLYFSMENLKKAIDEGKKSRPLVYAYEPRNGKLRDTVIFYSPLNDSSLFDWISFLQEQEEQISFVYRPVGQFTDEPVKFRGYGFEMRPFNYTMTYSKEQEAEIKHGNETEDSELIKMKHIIPGPNLPKPENLATQMIQFVKTTDDPFGALLEICENFPLYAHNISKIPAAQSLKEKILSKPENVVSGASAIYVNNRLIRNPDVYHILQASLDELRIAQMLLEHFSLTTESVNKSISLMTEHTPPKKYVIDYRSDYLFNLNDLETGKAYVNWTSDLSSLRTTNPQPIKRNVFNAVFFIDPLNYADMKTLEVIDNNTKLRAPVRFSYYLQSRTTNKLSKRVMNAWAHIRLRYGPRQAHQFLLDAKKEMKSGEKELKNFHFNNALENYCHKKLSDFDKLEPNSRERKFLKKMKYQLQKIGIHEQGCLFNGKFYPGKRQDKNIAEFIQYSLKRLRIKMGERKLTNKGDMDTLDAIFDGDDVFPRYNPLIQHTDKSPCEFISLISQSYHFQHEFMEWTKKIRYNSRNQSIKFSTIWVFIGEELTGSLEAKHMGFQIENWIQEMPDKARIAFFAETTTSNIIKNTMPPPFVQDLLQLRPDEVTIVMNGRVIRMKSRAIFDWMPDDFDMLLKWEYHRSVSMVEKFFAEDVALNYEIIQEDIDNIDASFHSQLALYLSFIYGYGSHNGIVRYPVNKKLFDEKNPACMSYNNPDSFIHYGIMLNPFELPFQRIAPIVKFLKDSKSFDVQVFINFPTRDASEYPNNLKAFHRFLLFDDYIKFDRFESHTVYSLMPHSPENWMVEPVSAPFDLDNFRPHESDPGLTLATYRLSSILLEGSALDEMYVPVHGLRITLDMGEKGYHDSLSIKTMGYFQLKTQPGIWEISLGEGASRTVYNISSKNTFSMSSFTPSWMTMRVSHNDGMTRYSVYNLPKELKEKTVNDSTIHVFAVVSGYTYERLVKIMMISAIKNTKSPIHFWFLKNFISSQFMRDLPQFAKKYNFQYSFVEYHWPAWVTPQTERQRIIWGNKILFFDALFPMNVSRIIYIDADAVVRGDLSELMNINLNGCPYGFVPFCTSRKEMKKYHFWTQGYWKRHLAGKRYHISAMFVVDLDRFRRMGAGDKLRKHYELIVGGSQSLANLDQDLPNDAQDEVPIFSLPKKYLWCCTWCSEKEKDRAIIIDLANNPKTKMSKVDMAKKFIEEWPLLDDEVTHIDNATYFNEYDLKKIRMEHKKRVTAALENKKNNAKKQKESEAENAKEDDNENMASEL